MGKKTIRKTLLHIAVYTVLFITLVPLFWVILCSFEPTQELFSTRILPQSLTVQHYVKVLNTSDFGIYFLNSLYVAFLTMGITTAFSIVGAYSTTRLRYRGREILASSIFVTYLFPGILLLIPLYVVMYKMRLVNTHAGLVILHTTLTLPFCLILLRAFFSAIPTDLEEAAMIDGCGKICAMVRIVLPLAVPGIVSIALFAFILSWNEYMFSMVMLNSASKWTLPIGLSMYLHTDEIRWEQLLAATVLVLVPVFLFFQVINRHLIAGLMAGSIKG